MVLPYVQGMSEEIARVLRREHIKVAYKPIKSVGSIFEKSKDKVEKDKNTRIVYEIAWKECNDVYIGQFDVVIVGLEVSNSESPAN